MTTISSHLSGGRSASCPDEAAAVLAAFSSETTLRSGPLHDRRRLHFLLASSRVGKLIWKLVAGRPVDNEPSMSLSR